MLIEKPQFDLNKVLPGTALFVTKKERGYKVVNNASIVIKAEPLKILVAYYEDHQNTLKHLEIKVSDITDKYVTLQPMVIGKELTSDM